MKATHPSVLALNAHGHPLSWMRWQDAVCYYVRDRVLWTAGDNTFSVYGGTNRRTNERSALEIHSIVALKGTYRRSTSDFKVLLCKRHNGALFVRDKHLCLYCGQQFLTSQLTRDHIIPTSRGGQDIWENVATSCLYCNQKKDNRTPGEAGLTLLAVPYAPNRAEFLILRNRKVLADQMVFLQGFIPKRREM